MAAKIPEANHEPAELDYARSVTTRFWFVENRKRLMLWGFLILTLVLVGILLRNLKLVSVNAGRVPCKINFRNAIHDVDDIWTGILPLGTRVQGIGASARVGPPLPVDLAEPIAGLRYQSKTIVSVNVDDSMVGCSGTTLSHHWWGVSLTLHWNENGNRDDENEAEQRLGD